MLRLGRCLSFGYLQGCAESDVQGHGVLGTLRRLWQGREQLNPGGHVADSFEIGRALTGLLPRPLPVDDRLLGAARPV